LYRVKVTAVSSCTMLTAVVVWCGTLVGDAEDWLKLFFLTVLDDTCKSRNRFSHSAYDRVTS